MSNTFGNIFCLTTFGESHGKVIGGVIDGCPSGIEIDENFIQKRLNSRRPGFKIYTTQRKELDKVEFLSGLHNGKTTGAPIGFIIQNTDVKSEDYDELRDAFRPSHGDYTYWLKYKNYDPRGGGRYSARETACRIVAGSIAELILKKYNNIEIKTFIMSVGNIEVPMIDISDLNNIDEDFPCYDAAIAEKMKKKIIETADKGDSIGGIVGCFITNVPGGLGEPIYNKISARLAYAMFSIPGCNGFDIGEGFKSINKTGSTFNDALICENGNIKTLTNNCGGIQAGITNGMPIFFRVSFKPTPSISLEQKTINKRKENVTIQIRGRHDPCIAVRAVPVVQAMAAIVILDMVLLDKAKNL